MFTRLLLLLFVCLFSINDVRRTQVSERYRQRKAEVGDNSEGGCSEVRIICTPSPTMPLTPTTDRTPLPGAFNSHIFLQRRFYRPICFYIEVSTNSVSQGRLTNQFRALYNAHVNQNLNFRWKKYSHAYLKIDQSAKAP